METNLNLGMTTNPLSAQSPVIERAITTKVVKMDKGDSTATLPSDRPYIAQVVAARLGSGDDSAPLGEIAPPERTLRPYDVPMLPFDKSQDNTDASLQVATSDKQTSATG